MKKPLIIVPLTYAVLLILGTLSYYSKNIMFTVVFSSTLIYLYLYLSQKKLNCYTGPEIDKILIFILFISCLLLVFRFFRIFDFPYDYYSDEWTDIMDSYLKLNGEKGILSYNARSGAALPYLPELIYSLFLVLFKQHIELMRLVPYLLVILTSAELYHLGKIIKDKIFGIALFFLYSVSGWTLFTSRELMANIFIPFLVVTFLLLFFVYIKTNKSMFLVGTFCVFFIGFFTYSAWVLMVPFTSYLLFEYRHELKPEIMKSAIIIFALSVVIAAVVYLNNYMLLKWSISLTIFKNNNIIIDLLTNIKHIPEFFFQPFSTGAFTSKLGILSFSEFLLLIGGLTACIVNIKDRYYRLFLSGFCISLFTLLISSDVSHYERHIMILPFMIILSGLFMQNLIRQRYSSFIITICVLFFINTAFYMFLDWNNQLVTSNRAILIAEYVNHNYLEDNCIFLYDTVPYGKYSAYLRSKFAYEKIPQENIDKVLFVSSPLLRYEVRKVFPGIKEKYFFEYDVGDGLPIVLYEVDVSKNYLLRKYFVDMFEKLNKVNVKMWGLEYEDAAQICEDYCETTLNDPLIVLKNTFLRYSQLKAYSVMDKGGEMAAVLFNKEKPMFLTSDWYMKISEGYYAAGNIKKAFFYIKEAIKAAPEWQIPKKALETFSKQGIQK